MGVETFFSQYSPKLGKYWLPIALALLGLIFFVYGLISLLGSASKTNEIKFEHENLSASKESSITVDIEGAVVNPGVYKLNQNSIIQDALVASGGLASDADREFVSKNINLASKLTDSAKIYIPRVNEQTPEVKGVSDTSIGIININQASVETLDTLPGIGAVTANKIITNRPYLTIQELLDKKIVSSKVFTQIKDKITAY
jgi:competence protein ComEA